MIHWLTATVETIAEERTNVQEAEVIGDDGSRMRVLHYTASMSRLAVGDRVRLNVTAGKLGLGSGGLHFVHDVQSSLAAEESGATPLEIHRADGLGRTGVRSGPGHIIKLRYTSLQRAVLAVEERASPHHGMFQEPLLLDGMPVLIGELHSMLPIAAVWLKQAYNHENSPLRLSYVMSDGGALPLAFSKHAARLRADGWITGTVTYGHAYGGDLEAVNKYTALLAARHVQKADIAIAVMGPGIVGTATPLGHTAVEMAELAHAVHALGGRPIIMPRVGFADRRPRHTGISHHLLETAGRLMLARTLIPFPDDLERSQRQWVIEQLEASGLDRRHDIAWIAGVSMKEAERRLGSYPADITTMGRGLRDDPAYFLCVCAAAEAAALACRLQ